MRHTGILLRGLGLALLLVLGCKTTDPKLRPEKQDEVLNVPPTTEGRFSNPLQYPKDTPKASSIKRGGSTVNPLTGPGSQPQSGPGTGRPLGNGQGY